MQKHSVDKEAPQPLIFYPQNFSFPTLFCGMTLRSSENFSGGFDIRKNDHRKIFDRFIHPFYLHMLPKQVHGSQVHVLNNGTGTENTHADGLATNQPLALLGIRVADCACIVLYDSEKHALALLHSGWRGCLLNIAAQGVKTLREKYVSNAQSLNAHVFPAAGADTYEVGQDIALQFTYTGSYDVRNSRYYLNMHKIIHEQLLETGIPVQNISYSSGCTINDQRFHSYRRDGKQCGVMLVFAGIQDKKQMEQGTLDNNE